MAFRAESQSEKPKTNGGSTILDEIQQYADEIRDHFDSLDEAREEAYNLSRQIVRVSSQAIKSVHRQEKQDSMEGLQEARELVERMLERLDEYPELRYGGFVRDAQKEYVEAAITIAVVEGEPVQGPEELGVDLDAWINGLAETVGEFRRHALDCIRRNDIDRAERFLTIMEEMYHTTMGFDYPKAICGGLRSRSDACRGMVERTRGDVTNALRQRRLEQRLSEFEQDG